jgi:hypothetical protein
MQSGVQAFESDDDSALLLCGSCLSKPEKVQARFTSMDLDPTKWRPADQWLLRGMVCGYCLIDLEAGKEAPEMADLEQVLLDKDA